MPEIITDPVLWECIQRKISTGVTRCGLVAKRLCEREMAGRPSQPSSPGSSNERELQRTTTNFLNSMTTGISGALDNLKQQLNSPSMAQYTTHVITAIGVAAIFYGIFRIFKWFYDKYIGGWFSTTNWYDKGSSTHYRHSPNTRHVPASQFVKAARPTKTTRHVPASQFAQTTRPVQTPRHVPAPRSGQTTRHGRTTRPQYKPYRHTPPNNHYINELDW